jgi:hypothetical protein
MIAFCSNRWSEIDARADQCRHCGTDSRSYEGKLVAALAHPLPESRASICWLIGENNIGAAVPTIAGCLGA